MWRCVISFQATFDDQQNLFKAPFEALILLRTVTLLSMGVHNDNMKLFCFGVKKWFLAFLVHIYCS